MTRNLTFALVGFLLILSSCQKEMSTEQSSNNSSGLKGTWNLVSMEVKTFDSLFIDHGTGGTEATVTSSAYTTLNNSGTLIINDTKMISKQFAYSVATMANSKVYADGSLLTQMQFPFNISIPPTDSEGTYTLIGTDSLETSGGQLVNVSGVSIPSLPSKMKYVIAGSTLKMFLKMENTDRQPILGEPALHVIKLENTITFKRA